MKYYGRPSSTDSIPADLAAEGYTYENTKNCNDIFYHNNKALDPKHYVVVLPEMQDEKHGYSETATLKSIKRLAIRKALYLARMSWC